METIRFIENVAASDVSTGFHYDAGPNAMLISITDPAGWKPKRKHDFKEVHEFEFLDAEDGDDFPEEAMISDEQAEQIVSLLNHALEKRMNVVVHCYAGICRSGAVVEVATMMGFTPTDRYRQPNLRVKKKMMQVLGLTYKEE
jgi:predicted protein tyrosine phosphatase